MARCVRCCCSVATLSESADLATVAECVESLRTVANLSRDGSPPSNPEALASLMASAARVLRQAREPASVLLALSSTLCLLRPGEALRTGGVVPPRGRRCGFSLFVTRRPPRAPPVPCTTVFRCGGGERGLDAVRLRGTGAKGASTPCGGRQRDE
mgnify:CR=1 FL=1